MAVLGYVGAAMTSAFPASDKLHRPWWISLLLGVIGAGIGLRVGTLGQGDAQSRLPRSIMLWASWG
jgi:hypothetical protein